MFAIGDYIVYGSNGICQVKDVTTIDMPGATSDRMYYVMAPLSNKESKIFSPVDNCKVVMRAVLTEEEANEIISQCKDIPLLDVVNERMLEMKYREVLASCDIRQLIAMVKTILKKCESRQSMGKKMTSMDERYLKKAEDSLYNELGIALGKTKEELVNLIWEK